MTNAFQQYLKDTQNELHHVAWPTREQTIIYTILVIAISFGVSVYLGLADFLFTSGLTRAVSVSTNSADSVHTPLVDMPAPSASNPSSSTLPADLGNKQQQ